MERLKSLGKTTQYKAEYDPGLLERISRSERRKDFKNPMFGYDIWNCYEVSCLDSFGKPIFTQLKIINDAASKYIWESKSLKLYLFSMNNTKFESINDLIYTIRTDLEKLIESTVQILPYKDKTKKEFWYYGQCLDDIELVTNVYTPQEGFLNPIKEDKLINKSYYSNLLRSNCEITNQPDWARIYISYKSYNFIDPGALLAYIVSFRNHQQFHEPTCETIYQTLYEKLSPIELTVICQYTRRGGIDINPVRTTINTQFEYYLPKVDQQ